MNTVDKYQRYVNTSFVKAVEPVVVERARGATVTDVDGKTYTDLFAGIAVVNAGHVHPRVADAARQQIDRLVHCCSYVYHVPIVADLAERLAAITPGRLQRLHRGQGPPFAPGLHDQHVQHLLPVAGRFRVTGPVGDGLQDGAGPVGESDEVCLVFVRPVDDHRVVRNGRVLYGRSGASSQTSAKVSSASTRAMPRYQLFGASRARSVAPDASARMASREAASAAARSGAIPHTGARWGPGVPSPHPISQARRHRDPEVAAASCRPPVSGDAAVSCG